MKDEKQQVLTITDFTPGIYSNGNYATNVPPAPIGAAQEANTYRCIGLPGGGLAPLPKRNTDLTIPWPGSGTTATVVGLQAIGGYQTASGLSATRGLDSVYVVLDTNASPRVAFVKVYTANSDTWTSVSLADVNWPPQDATGVASLNLGTTVPIGVASDTIVTDILGERGIAFLIGNTHIYMAMFPSSILQRFNTGGPQDGLLSHQQRIVYYAANPGAIAGGVSVLSGEIAYTYPRLYNFATGADTDGVNGMDIDKNCVWGAAGSISTGELFLVSVEDGESVVISGDLDNPTISVLRGVQGTGYMLNQAIPTSIGLIYLSDQCGAWVWNGSNDSKKISRQIRDNFFERTTYTGGFKSTTGLGEAVHPSRWGSYVVYPNNFLLDVENGSWWILEDPATKNFAIWSSHWGKTLWGAVDSIQSGTTNSMSRFDMGVPATSYSWQSQPIQVSQYGETIRVTDIEVKAVPSVADTNQTVTVTLTNRDNTTQPETIVINSKTTIPVRERVPTAMRGDDIIVRIEADGGANPAPVVHSISLVYDSGTPTA